MYSHAQADEWFAPLTPEAVGGRRVLELGCGNGSVLLHRMPWRPAYLEGVDLGDSVRSAIQNMSRISSEGWAVKKADLTPYCAETPFDAVYSNGVIHHLEEPDLGFQTVMRNVKPGGRFHCCVYAHEGNALMRWVVDAIR